MMKGVKKEWGLKPTGRLHKDVLQKVMRNRMIPMPTAQPVDGDAIYLYTVLSQTNSHIKHECVNSRLIRTLQDK